MNKSLLRRDGFAQINTSDGEDSLMASSPIRALSWSARLQSEYIREQLDCQCAPSLGAAQVFWQYDTRCVLTALVWGYAPTLVTTSSTFTRLQEGVCWCAKRWLSHAPHNAGRWPALAKILIAPSLQRSPI